MNCIAHVGRFWFAAFFLLLVDALHCQVDVVHRGGMVVLIDLRVLPRDHHQYAKLEQQR